MTIILPEIFERKKSLAAPPGWVPDGPGRLKLLSPLDIDQVTIAGLQLRGRTRQSRADEEVMFQLEYHPVGSRVCQLARIDWRPIHTHDNGNRGPDEWRLVNISESHYHSFNLNWFPSENRMLLPNLPIATPIRPDPADFATLLALTAELFRIDDMASVPVPEWTVDLL